METHPQARNDEDGNGRATATNAYRRGSSIRAEPGLAWP